jgi:trehalose/maltose hydrolase-like predicted phosphorylase
MSLVDERSWQISEAPFLPAKLHHTETIFTVGNGYMGLRATFEEGYPGELASTLVHGLYDHADGDLVPELVNLPNPLPIMIEADGETFTLQPDTFAPFQQILGYKRTLDLKTATLERGLIWRTRAGTILQITFERFASLNNQHLLAQRTSIRPLNRSCTVKITASIDATQTNEGRNHWMSLESGTSDNRPYVRGSTAQSGYTAAVMSAFTTDVGASSMTSHPDEYKPAVSIICDVEKEAIGTFYKYTAIHTSRDSSDPLLTVGQTLLTAQNRGWDDLKADHEQGWAKYWENSDVQIEGDEPAQRAFRFSTYHILVAAPQHDERVSIGAKTLSGPGYRGHVFWDTELFILPMLTVTEPSLTRNMLMYRYHNLQGARNKAKEAGYEGAMFPWESTDTGEETTPRWTNPQPDGTRIRIWTGDSEQHISTDIAYTVMQYWRWTNDEDFFVKYGAEIVLDTAVFWGSRVEYNDHEDRYELKMQIGPDEYHENINNSAFTNSMVRWHLRTALQVYVMLRDNYPAQAEALIARLNLTDERLDHWRDVTEKTYVPNDEHRAILEQFDGFFSLEPVNLSLWQPRVANMDYIIGHANAQKTMVIKQADIVMLMALLGDEFGSYEYRKRNWDFYSKVVDHGSSLSLSTHAWVAARLNLMDEAYRMFMVAANMDLEDVKGNVRDGIHAAAAGGLWQAIILGFAGLKLDNATFVVDPHLPDHWKSLTFRVFHKGQQHIIRLVNNNTA